MAISEIILLDDIVSIKYDKGAKKTLEEAANEGPVNITLLLKDGSTHSFQKPIKVQRKDSFFFLKVPNPGMHKPEVAYIEAALARLGSQLLPQHGILIPKYEIIDLVLDSPEGQSTTPCCLIEALDQFTPFGECGTDFQADSTRVHIRDPEKQERRTRQLDLIYSPAFAAFSAFCHLIGNNDPHQENFGTAVKNGRTIFAAIDFDMGPMPFLIENELFGPYNHSSYVQEEYNLEEGGRHTPLGINFGIFPLLSEREETPTPDNWVTNWCHGYRKGLEQRPLAQVDHFKDKVFETFNQFARLDPYTFSHAFQEIEPRNPALLNRLTEYFVRYTAQLQNALKTAENQSHPSCSSSPMQILNSPPIRPDKRKHGSELSDSNSSFFLKAQAPITEDSLLDEITLSSGR